MYYHKHKGHINIKNKKGKPMQKSKKIIATLGVVAGLGVATLPLASYAATHDTTVSLTVSPAISMSVTGTTSVTLEPNRADLTTMSNSVSISTNNLKGYTLTVADKDTDNALVHTTKTDKKIPSTDATPTAGTSSWAVQAGGNYTGMTAGFDTAWKAMPKSDGTALIIRKTGEVANAITNEVSVLKIGVALSDSQETGTYTDQIVYTAVADN